MEVSCLEEVRTVLPECAFINPSGIDLLISLGFLQAEELDLPEILKKKEEITETRNALFREISHEKREYVCSLY